MLAGFTSRCTRPAAWAASRADVTAGHEPHSDEQHPVRVAGFEYRDDVRIIHCRCGPGFTHETAPEFVVCRQRGRQDLECYLPVEPFVPGPEDDRHAAFADLLFQ